VVRLPSLFVVGVVTVVVAAGCAGSSHHRTVEGSSGKFPIVVAHPDVQTTGFSSAVGRRVSGDRAVLLSPSQVAFMTSGSISCVWLPTRLTVLGPSAIRIDMRVNGRVSSCGSGAVGFPVAVKIPRAVDSTRPVTVRRAYTVRLPGVASPRRWSRTSVAPAFSR
jgi:hypothetical protein